ncbi:MAG: recombinase family protein [Oscillospiraceae bacterium]|nr:recombinase family protein [Oscillospiraceae bacterium]
MGCSVNFNIVIEQIRDGFAKKSRRNTDNGNNAFLGLFYGSEITLVVKSMDRLSRSKADIRNELQYFKDHGIRLRVIDLPTTMMELPEGQEWVFEMVNNILIEVLGTIAEQERVTIKQRQKEGIESARKKGVKFGRREVALPANWKEVYASWRAGQITAKKAMERTGLKKSTFYRFAADEEARDAHRRECAAKQENEVDPS